MYRVTPNAHLTDTTNNTFVSDNFFEYNDETATNGEGLFKAGTGSSGKILSGQLEMSNVDLTEEFTEMIVAQRGFQANSRIITTSDSILEELVNLKR